MVRYDIEEVQPLFVLAIHIRVAVVKTLAH